MIDTHAHLTDAKLLENIEEVRNAYLNLGVNKVIDIGCDLLTSRLARDNAEKFSEVYFSVGLHPENAKQYNNELQKEFENIITHKKCLAVGEIGLDYRYEGYDKKEQFDAFLGQIIMADKHNLPFLVHTRDASKDTLDFLKANKKYLNNGFIMHCYSESRELVKDYLDLGGYFAFNGVVTFKNAKKRDVIKEVPLDRIFVETDCPYLSPEPFRGTINSPKNIPIIYEFISNVKETSVEELNKQINDNFCKLFKKINM